MIATLTHFGLLLIFVNVLVEQLGAPVPAFPTLMAAGTLIAQGTLAWGPTVAVAFVASTLADVAWYLAGRHFGNGVMRLLCRLSLSPDSCVRQTEDRYGRLGGMTLVIAKFVPGLATVATPVAGALGLGWGAFLGLSSLGTVLWIGAAIGAGALLRDQITTVLDLLASWGPRAVLLIAVLFSLYIFNRWLQRRRFLRLLRIARVSAHELRQLFEAGQDPFVVDVRSRTAKSLDPRVIPGAHQFDVAEAEERLAEFPRDRDIVFYCTCPNDASAAFVARVLIEHGYKRVRPLAGGLDAWIEAGFATEVVVPLAPAIEGEQALA